MKKLGQVVGAGVLAAALLGSAGMAWAQDFAMVGWERYFSLQWEPGERHGKPNVNGYVRNDWGEAARHVQLKVESLDAAGQVTATSTNYVIRTVAAGSREYFEVPVPAPAPSYRVSVLAFELVQAPSDGGGKP